MGWISLLDGIAINVTGVVDVKVAQNVEQPGLAFAGYAAYFIGFFVLSLSFKYLDMSLAYAFWSGLGSALIIAVGVLFFNKSLTASKLAFFSLIMLGVTGVSLTA